MVEAAQAKDAAKAKAGDEARPEFGVQRIYVKDLSFEAPDAPYTFQKEWKPEVKVDLQTTPSKVADNVHQVVLTLTIEAKNDDKVAFLTEVQQAGIFTLNNYSDDQQEVILSTVAPNIIFPYARETVSDLIVRGGFPSLYLNPINFDALYAQQKAKEEEEGGKAGGKTNGEAKKK